MNKLKHFILKLVHQYFPTRKKYYARCSQEDAKKAYVQSRTYNRIDPFFANGSYKKAGEFSSLFLIFSIVFFPEEEILYFTISYSLFVWSFLYAMFRKLHIEKICEAFANMKKKRTKATEIITDIIETKTYLFSIISCVFLINEGVCFYSQLAILLSILSMFTDRWILSKEY